LLGCDEEEEEEEEVMKREFLYVAKAQQEPQSVSRYKSKIEKERSEN
jgi:hypothetical protein